ncbi:RHS repeat-associated core domain-containing protein [Streptomyces sedi]|nr:RHS repeat-associated core domain-containing protein [Streptomyces sedi]
MERDPTPGDPDEVRELADDLQEFADDVGEALGKIRGLASERAVMDWAGLSAEAFRAEFDGVPGNLTKLEESYSLCAQALQAYWPKLQTAQGMADRALDRAISAQSDLTSAQSALGDAEDWVGRAGDEAERLQREGERENVEPPSEDDVRAAARDHQAAQAAAGAARSQASDAEERLTAARQLAREAEEMREEAAHECARDIDEASDAGIQNRRWWEKAIKWATDNWDTLVEICKVIVAVLGVVVMIIGGPLAWVVLAAALVVLADTLIKFARGEAGLLDVAFAAFDCIPGLKGLTTLGGLARGLRGVASAGRTGLRGLAQGARGLGRNVRERAVDWGRRNFSPDPVDFATGEVGWPSTDLDLPGVLPLVLRRHHLSSYRDGRLFGRTWASTLDQRLILEEHGVRFLAEDGKELHYPVPLADVDSPVLPVEGSRWPLSWDGQPGSEFRVHQQDSGLTFRFAPVTGHSPSECLLLAIEDRNGNVITLSYDEHGVPTEVRHSGGYRVGVAVLEGRVTSLRLLSHPGQPLLRAYEYDESRNLAKVYNSSGLPLEYSYDEAQRLTRWEDRNGVWYRYEYDEAGRCVFGTGTYGVLEYRYRYEPEEHRTTAIDSLGNAKVYQFNDCFQLVAETDALGRKTLRTWDRYDRAMTVTDPLGHMTRFEYDESGHLAALTRPNGGTVRVEYNELGLVTSLTEADGSLWRQSFDALGNRTAVLDPAGHRTRYTHDEHGGLSSFTEATGETTRFECDAAGLPLSATDPLGERTSYRRDAFGRVIEQVSPLGARQRVEYAPDGRPLRKVDPLGGVQTWEWDAEGNLLRHVDEHGGVTRFEYGPFDLLTARSEPDGARYEFLRDAETRVTRVIAPLGHTWEYVYDAAGHLVEETDYDGRTSTYTVDPLGRVLSRTNATAQTVTYRRDSLGNIIEKRAGDQVTTYDYDLLGRLTAAEEPACHLGIQRDQLGRILSETVDGLTLIHTYDGTGRPLSRTTPGGVVSIWAYDDAGRAATLTTAGRTLSLRRDAEGRLTERSLGSDIVLGQGWDGMGRLTNQSLTLVGQQVRDRGYAYRSDHHLRRITDNSVGTVDELTLDQIGRVTAVARPWGAESYAYDLAGNQLAAHLTGSGGSFPGAAEHDGERTFTGSRVTRAGRFRYTYDQAGRTVTRQKTMLSRKPETWRYEWDAEDRLVLAITPDGERWHYRYDPLGRRVAKERLAEDGRVVERTRFTWDDFTLVEETGTGRPGGESVARTWEYEGPRPVVQVDSAGGPRSDDIDRRFFAIITDLVGTPTELVDEAGAIAWRSHTTLWGLVTHELPGGTETPLRFPGQYHDRETGWHHNVFRHYDPATARFTTPDPLGLAAAPNHYGYVHNPCTLADPLGLTGEEILPPGYTSSPALEGDPYHPDMVAERSQQNRDVYGPSVTERARELGYDRRIPPNRAPFDSHRQPVFSNGRNYITPDVDGHNVADGWKMFDRRGRRTGTYDSALNYVKK